eukprot:gb/GECG01007747.1/.p1 GENE.gb/GECG01007747.1/~~gb/GECG01007747.1/.p1  ORF type:complete len:366 (+),score=19.16 gb/GECG01007747.1/:1-1098(+)
MRTFAIVLALCTVAYTVQAEKSDKLYFPADATTLGSECSWIKECSLSPPPGCEQYSFHERPCSCLTPAAKCMYEHWKGFNDTQREEMYDQCGQTQFPFGVHMHYLQQKNCDFVNVAQEELDKQREVDSYSYSCGWTVADGSHSGSTTTYTHSHLCLKAPGWPSYLNSQSLNYTASVLHYSGGVAMIMFLRVHDDAGIDYHFYSADNTASHSGKLEPGDAEHVCSNALLPHFRVNALCQGLETVQPRTSTSAYGTKWVRYFKNRNWIHKAHVSWEFGANCFNGLSSKNDYSLCTNGQVNWGLVDDSLTTEYAINGCKMQCDGEAPCCISTGNPPSTRTGCGNNCANCEGGCPSTRGYYHRGAKPAQ